VRKHETTARARVFDVLRRLSRVHVLQLARYRQNADSSRGDAKAIGLADVRGAVQSIRMQQVRREKFRARRVS